MNENQGDEEGLLRHFGEVDPEFLEYQAQLRAANRKARLNPTPEQAAAEREWAKNLRVAEPPVDPKPGAE